MAAAEARSRSDMAGRKLYIFAAAVETATGLALIIYPPIVTELLLGEGVSGTGLALGRVAGFALLSLGLACWPSRVEVGGKTLSLRAMLTYNLLITVYLLVLGAGGESTGKLLWPAVVLHGALTLLLASMWFRA